MRLLWMDVEAVVLACPWRDVGRGEGDQKSLPSATSVLVKQILQCSSGCSEFGDENTFSGKRSKRFGTVTVWVARQEIASVGLTEYFLSL